MTKKETSLMLLLLAISGARSREFFFVDLLDDRNFSQSLEYCTNITYSEPDNVLQMPELQNISNCARKFGINGTFWINYETDKSYTTEPSTWHCRFESTNPCFLSDVTQGGFSWTRNTGSTNSSNTGPLTAYEGYYYIYMEASRVSEGQQFILESDKLPDVELCLFFRYHMYGDDVGRLMIILASDTDDIIWEQSGRSRYWWRSHRVDIKPSQNRTLLRIVAVKGKGYRGDIALDDVRLRFGLCNEHPDCGETFYTNSGLLLSERYPYNYPSGRDCSWEIIVSEGKHIVLHVNDFHLEISNDGKWCLDHLKIFDGNDGSHHYTLCGEIEDRTYKMYTNYLILDFHSNDQRQKKGFNITWTTVSVTCPAVRIASGYIEPVSQLCSDVLQTVICLNNKPFVTDTECQFYPPQPTIIESSTSIYLTTDDGKSTLNNTQITTKYGIYQKKSSPTKSQVIPASVGAAVGVVALIVIIATVICLRRRRQDRRKKKMLHGKSVFNQNYSFDTSQGIILNSTDQENYFKLEEKQKSKNAHTSSQIDTQTDKADNYENTKPNQDDPYNHLNEAATGKETNDYSQCKDLNSYDHLPSHVSPGDATLDDNYDHAGKDVDADDNYDHAESDMNADNYDHAGKDVDVALGSMMLTEESDYMNDTAVRNECDDFTYDKAGNIA